MDSLLSIVQMPSGVPVATVGIGQAKNAGILALRILAPYYPKIATWVSEFCEAQTGEVLAKNLDSSS